jgi:uncharacterized membrane protein YeaQ/YmgE (transglycosylase-associated protein family)
LSPSTSNGFFLNFGKIMISNIIGWCIFGLIAGAIARLLTPGRDPMGCLGTIAVGVAGSFLGGFVVSLLFGDMDEEFQPAGIIGAVVGGVVVLLLLRRFSRR